MVGAIASPHSCNIQIRFDFSITLNLLVGIRWSRTGWFLITTNAIFSILATINPGNVNVPKPPREWSRFTWPNLELPRICESCTYPCTQIVDHPPPCSLAQLLFSFKVESTKQIANHDHVINGLPWLAAIRRFQDLNQSQWDSLDIRVWNITSSFDPIYNNFQIICVSSFFSNEIPNPSFWV